MNTKLNKKKLVAAMLSVGFVILTAISSLAQEQKDPFKKEKTGKTENITQPQQPPEESLVSIEMRMIEIPRQAADELFKEQGSLAKTFVINEKTLDAISEMVIKNKAKVVSQSKIITQSGANCQNKSVREFTYPAEYVVCESDATTSVETLPNSKSGVTNSVSVEALPGMLIPAAFETRDCGTIFDVTPVIGPDNQTIDVVCIADRVRLSAYPNKITMNSPAGKIEVERPVFLSENVTTSFAIQDGHTVLVSVCNATSDQAEPAKAGEDIILVIMTACVVPVN